MALVHLESVNQKNSYEVGGGQFEQRSYLFNSMNMPLLDEPAQGKSGVQAYSASQLIYTGAKHILQAVTGLHLYMCAPSHFCHQRDHILINRYASRSVGRARLKAVSGSALRIPFRPSSVRWQKTHGKVSTVNTKMLDYSRRFGVVLYELTKGAHPCSLIRFAFSLMAKPGDLATPFQGSLNAKSTENLYRV